MATTSAPRITARVDNDTQALLTQAAAISGMSSINSFVLSAAVEKAKHLIEQEQRIELTAQDTKKLITALDKPASASERLSRAFNKHNI
jgi:uncharacterized protein (DUF1778 family)